jgi:hypothetical protein
MRKIFISPRVTPDSKKVCTGRDLAEALAETKLPDEEAANWYRDLQKSRKKNLAASRPSQ